jgi:hypothetical protein
MLRPAQVGVGLEDVAGVVSLLSSRQRLAVSADRVEVVILVLAVEQLELEPLTLPGSRGRNIRSA